jgi:uncharacterized protein YciI
MAVAIGGCKGSGETGGSEALGAETYVLCYLKNGPKTGQGTREERQEIFRGHMSNMQTLAEQGKLVIAGPFDAPRDKTWRGIFVLTAKTADEATAITATDPGVKAGEFSTEMVVMRGSDVLHQTAELDRKAKENLPPQQPGQPPANIRKYVMVHAKDAQKAGRALEQSGWRSRVVWAGTFEGSHAGECIVVLDATEPAEVQSMLTSNGAGEIGVDGWWSTTSLMDLPDPVGSVLP